MIFCLFIVCLIVSLKGNPLSCQLDQTNEIYKKDCEAQKQCQNKCCPLKNYENIQISNRSNIETYSYCYKAINYDLDFQTFENHQIQGKYAFQNYSTIYNKYLETKTVEDNKDCLAILRLFFCGIQFPRCENGNKIGGSLPQEAQMCTFLCDILSVRCQEPELYNQYCQNQNSNLCQHSHKIYVAYIFIIFFLSYI